MAVILTISSSSASTRSYALNATQNIIAVTPSKQCIHFFLSDLCPPTSNILKQNAKAIKQFVISCRTQEINLTHYFQVSCIVLII